MRLNFPSHSPIPILLLSDAPECLTGLARIGRDLAQILSLLPQFRVGYLGRGGVGRRSFPWTQYSFPESGQWGEQYLPRVWQDFSNGQQGVVMSLWDASRMLWFGAPQSMQGYPELQQFLGEGRQFEKWGYFPIDGSGVVEDQLPMGMRAAIAGYDRVITASEGAQGLIARWKLCDWLPHGVHMQTFGLKSNRPGLALYNPREYVPWNENDIIVGCVMSNQSRKDWPIAMEAASLLKLEYGNRFKLWAHTDTLLRYWDLQALACEYGVNDCIEVTLDLTDEQMAARYSACDTTMLPSAGEGFGYPIAESMACGTACVVTDYAAGQEIVPEDWRCMPVAYRIDTMHNVRRAVLSAWGFAGKCKQEIEKKKLDWEGRGAEIRGMVEHLGWDKLRVQWEKWFLAGIQR